MKLKVGEIRSSERVEKMYHWKGAPYEIGLSHGKELKEQVHHLYSSWYDGWVKTNGVSEVEKNIRKNLPRYEVFFQNDAPEVLEEIKGIADGSGMTYKDILLLNVLEEIRLEMFYRFNPFGCTQIAVTDDITSIHRLLIGKNEDGGDWNRGQYVHAKIEPKNGHKFIMLLQPGRVAAYIGFSETGLCFSQSSAGVENDIGFGYPRLILFRLMMERCSTVEDALDFMSAHNYAVAGINLMLADQKSNVVLIEKTHSHQAERYPEDGILIGVNVFRSSSMRPLWTKKMISNIKDSVLRIERILELLEPQKGKIDHETLKNILRDHKNGENSICSHGGWRPTGSSYIYDPKSIKIQISEGRPCQNEYHEYKV
jgi:isopenicillin-N N-acyltransferase-like protein